MIKAVLKPLVINGQVIPHQFEDSEPTRERGYTEYVDQTGAKIYYHESGYGYLPADEVLIVA